MNADSLAHALVRNMQDKKFVRIISAVNPEEGHKVICFMEINKYDFEMLWRGSATFSFPELKPFVVPGDLKIIAVNEIEI